MMPLRRRNLPRDQCQGDAFDTRTDCSHRRAFMRQRPDHVRGHGAFRMCCENTQKNSFHEANQQDHPYPIVSAKTFGFTFSEFHDWLRSSLAPR